MCVGGGGGEMCFYTLNCKTVKNGNKGKFLLKFFHTHTYEGIEYIRKMSNVYFSRKRCLK